MNCKESHFELTSYLDGVLDSNMRVDLEQHLPGRSTAALVDTTRKTIQIFCNLRTCPLPEDVRKRLVIAPVA